MTTVKQLMELLNKYPDDMPITSEQNEDFIHIVNIQNNLILSTNRPIGYCKRSGEYVYNTDVEGYSAFSPALDEDLFHHEWERL